MRFDTNQVGEQGLELCFALDKLGLDRLLDFGPDDAVAVRAASGLEVKLTAFPAETDYMVTGKIGCSVQQQCIRCLAPVVTALDLPVNVIYTRQKPQGGADTELFAEDMDVYGFNGDLVDLAPMVRESIILGVSDYPLCKHDCAGLCPVCGKDLNGGPCSCKVEDVDPRFAGLKDFKL